MMWKGMYSFRPSVYRQRSRIKSIHDFLCIAQQNTHFFHKRDGNDRGPYRLFPQQVRWLTLLDREKPKIRALLASRDKGKSEVVTILGTAWNMYHNPRLKFGIMSFNYSNASRLVYQIVEVLESVGVSMRYRDRGYYTTETDAHTPNVMALGLMSSVRGLHFDYLIMDDPLTITQQHSQKYIDRSRYFVKEGASIADRIILIGQLLTRNDLYYDAFGDATGHYYVLQSWHGDIPELDKDLVELEATIGRKELARNYLGIIEDEEEEIFQSIQFSDIPLNFSEGVAFIDPSAKGRDYTAVAIGFEHDATIIIYGKIFKRHWGSCLKELSELIASCHLVFYEDNQGKALGSMLANYGIYATGITSTANKVAKIYSLRGLVLSNRLKLHNSMDSESIMQVKNWSEHAEHDDLPDAIAMLVQRIGWVLRNN